MREIKFRANRFGKVFDVLEWNFTGHPDRQDLLLGLDGKECIRESIKNLDIMQYTGLKDRNGKEIYEGDIVSWIKGFGKIKYTSKIVFEEGDATFRVSGHGMHRLFSYEGTESVEVVGNIYENPELLKDSE